MTINCSSGNYGKRFIYVCNYVQDGLRAETQNFSIFSQGNILFGRIKNISKISEFLKFVPKL